MTVCDRDLQANPVRRYLRPSLLIVFPLLLSLISCNRHIYAGQYEFSVSAGVDSYSRAGEFTDEFYLEKGLRNSGAYSNGAMKFKSDHNEEYDPSHMHGLAYVEGNVGPRIIGSYFGSFYGQINLSAHPGATSRITVDYAVKRYAENSLYINGEAAPVDDHGCGYWRGSIGQLVCFELRAHSYLNPIEPNLGYGGRTAVSIVWGTGYMPGLEKHHSLPFDFKLDLETPVSDGGVMAGIEVPGCSVTGVASTTCPVTEDYGYGSSLFFGTSPSAASTSSVSTVPGHGSISPSNVGSPIAATTSSPSAATAYGFMSDGPNFARIILPDVLPGGDDSFELLFGDTLVPVSAGRVFDFTSHVPGGVTYFVLLGIDPAEGFDPTAPPPFVTGLQFADMGITTVYTATYSPVPEPSTLALLGVSVIGLLACAWRRRKRAGYPAAAEQPSEPGPRK